MISPKEIFLSDLIKTIKKHKDFLPPQEISYILIYHATGILYTCRNTASQDDCEDVIQFAIEQGKDVAFKFLAQEKENV